MKKCILCGEMTEGSVGAAGIRWTIICQECKDREDTELARLVTSVTKSVDLICKALRPEKCKHEGEHKNGICLECGEEV
jgi:hypothetical protein